MPTAPPQTPPAAAGNVAARIKRIPTPVLLIAGGAGLGIVIAIIRGRKNAADTAAANQTAGTDGADLGYDPADPYGAGNAASPVAYVNPSQAPADTGETVGAVGMSALDTLSAFLPGLEGIVTAALETRPPANPTIIPPVNNPPPAAPGGAGRPSPGTPPRGNCLPRGYHRGDTIRDGNLSHRVPGGIGWVRYASGGAGRAHWIHYHVRTHTAQLTIEARPNVRPQVWRKIGEIPKPPC